jgi:hypothetical protein
MERAPSLDLSSTTAHRIDWQVIEDVFGLTAGQERRAASGATANEPLSAEDRDDARRAFAVAQQEFGKTLVWLRTTMRLSLAAIILAVAVGVAGGALIQISPWASLISIASIGSLFGLLPKAFGLARDQAMLELIPARYTLALELCATKQDLQKLLTRFLDETSSARSGSTSRKR